jgi:hypothetical protein
LQEARRRYGDRMIPNDTRTGPPNSARVICPVDGCPWRHKLGHQRPRVLADRTVDEAVRSALLAETKADDELFLRHVSEHPVEDFLRTIAELRAELAEAGRAPA